MNINFLNSFLFHPRKSYHKIGKNDHMIPVDNHVKVSTRFHMISFTASNILFFHGNGEIGSEYDDIASIYNSKGFNFIIADYRGYGFSNGMPNIKNTMKDAHLILDYVINYLKVNQYSDTIILMGRSLGSVSVLEISKRYPFDFKGLIIESGISNEEPLFYIIGTTATEVGFKTEDGFQNYIKIGNYNGPLLVIHALDDHIVPFSQGEELIKLCPSLNKKLLPIPNANHNNILNVNPQLYFKEITYFINKII